MHFSCTLLLTIISICGQARAAEYYIETWDGGGFEGWYVLGSTAQMHYQPADGNPGGFVLLTNTTPDLIEFGTNKPQLTGDLHASGITSVTVDLNLLAGEATEARMKVMTKGDEGFTSGWRCTIEWISNPEWATYSLAFDPTWSDAEAEAAGWYSGPFTTASFSETMSNVTVVAMQLFGIGATEIGVDNFGYQPCLFDLNGDGYVGTGDLLELFTQWGTDGPADFDGNGAVGTGDLLILFANWGPCK